MKVIKEKIVVLKDKGSVIEREIRERTLGYIVAGFGLVTGLAWNEAIKAFIEGFFPMNRDTIKAKFLYAVLMTIVAVVISVYLVHILKGDEEKDEEEEEKEIKKTTKKTKKKKKTE